MKLSEEKLVSYLEKEKIDSFYIHNNVNVRYMCKYSGGDAYLLLLKNKFYLLTDPRCLEHAIVECPAYDCIDWRPYGSIVRCLGMIIQKENIKTMAVEEEHLAYSMYEEMKQECQCELLKKKGVLEEFQKRKEKEEIRYMQTACEISQRAFERLYGDVRPGITEKELEARLTMYMAMEDADVKVSPNRVVSGTRTAVLHAGTSMKAVEYGDLVRIEFGCRYQGYGADLARTLIVGKATDKQKRVYRMVYNLYEKSISLMKAGIAAGQIYERIWSMIAGTEYEMFFQGLLGYGVGLLSYQKPFLEKDEEEQLEENMVIAVGPGIYIQGWGGICIKDDVLIQKNSVTALTNCRKQIQEVF